MQTEAPTNAKESSTLAGVVMTEGPEDTKWPLPPTEERPGALDSKYFTEDESVAFWKSYVPLKPTDGVNGFLEKLQEEVTGPRAHTC